MKELVELNRKLDDAYEALKGISECIRTAERHLDRTNKEACYLKNQLRAESREKDSCGKKTARARKAIVDLAEEMHCTLTDAARFVILESFNAREDHDPISR